MRNNIRSTRKLTNTSLGKPKKCNSDISNRFGVSLITDESDASNLLNTYYPKGGFETSA